MYTVEYSGESTTHVNDTLDLYSRLTHMSHVFPNMRVLLI